jgi:hypothetical protein
MSGPEPPRAAPAAGKPLRRLSGAVHATLVLLVLQFILGAYAVAEVSYPTSALSVSQYLMGKGNDVVLAHMALAVLLLLVGLVALVLAFSAHRGGLTLETLLGLLFLVVASSGGYQFLFVTYQSTMGLLLMVGGFVGALVVYILALVSTRRGLRSNPAVPA